MVSLGIFVLVQKRTTSKNGRGKRNRALFRFRTMPYVQSSALERVTYDEETHTLRATFRESHRTYIYEDVPQELYDALIFSASLGRFFNAHIRDHFPRREVPSREN